MYAIRNLFAVSWLAIALASGGPAPTSLPTSHPASAADRISTDEASAIDALRAIVEAQERFKSGAHIDTNCDGEGEYGYFAEIAGSVAMRVGCHNCQNCQPEAGNPAVDVLLRPLLRRPFGILRWSCVSYRGYLFQMWLPGPVSVGRVAGTLEDSYGGKQAAPYPDPVNGAHMWCCYAWPVAYELTGRRAFFVNERGEVLEYANRSSSPYSGRPIAPHDDNGPGFDEAYSVSGDMGSPLRIGVANANGTIWYPVP